MKWSELKQLLDDHPDVNDDTEIDWIDIGGCDVDEIDFVVGENGNLQVS